MWKILRILTTNRCNYNCIYCHNEGQRFHDKVDQLSFDDFVKVQKSIIDMGFVEVRVSGGEPLLNPATIEMIEWLNKNTDYEIGLASNGSILTEKTIDRLSRTRTMITLNMPSIKPEEYKRITKMEIDSFMKTVELLESMEIEHSFNFVLHPENIRNIDDVLRYTVSRGKRIKLLPFIEEGFKNYSQEYLSEIRHKLNSSAIQRTEIGNQGLEIWDFEGGGRVKLLLSPCYDGNISRCREYGELRLLPDMTLKSCIFQNDAVSIRDADVEGIRRIIEQQWRDFNSCIKRR